MQQQNLIDPHPAAQQARGLPRRDCLLKLAALALAATVQGRAQAVAPELRALQLVVPTPPGSQPDLIARWLLEPMAQRAGIPGLVINKPGAAGVIAVDAVLAAAPETGSLLLGGLDHLAYSHLNNNNRKALDPFVDFVPVGAVNRDTWVLAVGGEQPVPTLAALVERARSRGPLSFASTGEGSTAHLLSARLARVLGVQAQHVPYKEPWLPDLIGGRIDFVVAPTPAVIGPLRGGRIRALATLTDERLALPGAPPSIRELGWPEQVFHGGLFLFAPAALAPLAPRLNAWLVQVLSQADIGQRFRDAAIEPLPLGLEATAESVRERLRQVDTMRLAVFGRAR